ncbi:MAG: MBL fold metallo-hydrolase [Aggregatilineales bacterium]
MLQSISPDLFLFQDTCNVYVIRDGSDAVLIDFGNGDVMPELGSLGITHVTDVLMTHHHRDQGQGLHRAVEIGASIWVPHTEQDLFANVEAYWQARPVYNNYDVRQDRFSLLSSVPIAGTLHDYETRRFGTHTFHIIPTPGHTIGSISVMVESDGQYVVFTGDLIAAPGKVWSLAATQWTYNGGEGISSSILSLLELQERLPACLLPSHGDPMHEPTAAIQPLVERLDALRKARGQNPRLLAFREHPYVQILPHLLRNLTSIANSYVLLSENGSALILDFGYDFVTWPLPAGTDRSSRRPWLYTIPMLKRDFGVQRIDVVIPTHYHDDHVAGMNMLREVEGTQIWAAETFADVLERPQVYNLPCLWYDPIPVDRRLPLEKSFAWEEYTFTLYPLPGHTLYAIAIAFEVDGTRVLATGDQYQEDSGTAYNYVYENRFQIGDYRRSAELYARLDPQLIVTGHWEPLWVQAGYFDTLRDRGETLDHLHRDLLPLDSYDLGGGDFAARIEPYQVTITDGTPRVFDVVVRNPHPQMELVRMVLDVPSDWIANPPQVSVLVEPHTETRLTFKLHIPRGTRTQRTRIAADITIGDQHIGEHAEALVTVKTSSAKELS